MTKVHTDTWNGAGFFPDVRNLLKPRVLADGYSLQCEDEGKQAYARPGMKESVLGTGRMVGSMVLTVTYILLPHRTEVTFFWDSSDCPRAYLDEMTQYARALAKDLKAYLNEWIGAVGELEAPNDGVSDS